MNWLQEHYGNTEGPLGFPMPDRTARQLDTLLKSLPNSKDYDYRKIVSTKGVSELNSGERSDVSWISTESVDRAGEVVLARGMNDAQFQANPVVTLGHAYHVPPAGKSLWRKHCKDGDLRGIKAKTVYPPMPEGWKEQWMPDRVYPLVQAGLLNGKSIGFLPTRVHLADRKEAQKNNWEPDTLVIDEWLMLEYACVFFPCNPDSLVEQVSKSGHTLTDEMLAALGINVEEWKKLLALNPHTKGGDPLSTTGRPLRFVPVGEIERAVQLALAKVNMEEIVRKSVELACERRMGRV